jgi:hypothetical protein
MGIWRDPLDELISDLERVVPSADATIADIPSMVEYPSACRAFCRATQPSGSVWPQTRGRSACMRTTNGWDVADGSQSHNASTATATAAKSDSAADCSYNLRDGRPMYSGTATLRPCGAAMHPNRHCGVRVQRSSRR